MFLKTFQTLFKDKPAVKAGLEYAFEDSKGRKYFFIPEKDTMILDRLGMINGVLDEISCGLSELELTKLCEYGESGLKVDAKNQLDIAKAAFAFHEIKRRRDMLVHPELLLKLVAWIVVREDEDPKSVDLPTHFDKVKQFREDIDKGLPLRDFFLRPRIMGYLPFINGISENLEKYWEEGNRKTQSLQAFLHLHTQDGLESNLKNVNKNTLG